jgi:polyisoprenoid-binding protein YceI
MKKLCLFLIVALGVICNLPSSAQVYTTQSASLSFYSSARVENIEATSKKCAAVLNTATNELLVKVTISTFQFKNGLMQEHFNETYMEIAKYPNAQFSGKINEQVNYKSPGTYSVTVTGILTVHGVAVERTIPGKIVVTASSIGFSSLFVIPVSAHKISIPNDKISNIAQDIQVTVQADCTPYVKK